MSRYYVEIPFVGYAGVEVEADDKEAAIEAVLMNLESRMTLSGEGMISPECIELEFQRRISQGNFLYAPLNNARATKDEDEE